MKFRDEVDLDTISCMQVLICEPVSEGSCKTKQTYYEAASGKRNAFSYFIGSNYQPGNYRLHLKLFQVVDPDQLIPRANGSFTLSDAQRYHTSKDFIVKGFKPNNGQANKSLRQ